MKTIFCLSSMRESKSRLSKYDDRPEENTELIFNELRREFAREDRIEAMHREEMARQERGSVGGAIRGAMWAAFVRGVE